MKATRKTTARESELTVAGALGVAFADLYSVAYKPGNFRAIKELAFILTNADRQIELDGDPKFNLAALTRGNLITFARAFRKIESDGKSRKKPA